MNNQNQNITELLELANKYPSPHNGQPIVLQQTTKDNFNIYFQKDRGLQAAEVSFLFSYVAMGVFVYHLSMCAKALGFDFTYALKLPKVKSLKGSGLIQFATCRLESGKDELDEEMRKVLLFRQTSRKKYYEGLDNALSQKTIELADKLNMKLVKMNREGTHQAIWLNQRAVFDDMFDDAVRLELKHWLRFSKKDKETKKDGLAYDCMELNGTAMKFIVNHHKLLRLPGISLLLKKYYLRTMSDNSDTFYLLTPFSTETEAYEVGIAVMQIWEVIAAKGYYLHPFGTIMSNVAAHDDFLKLAHIDHEDRHKNFLVFIYRAGKSEKPISSLRIPVNEHLLKHKNV